MMLQVIPQLDQMFRAGDLWGCQRAFQCFAEPGHPLVKALGRRVTEVTGFVGFQFFQNLIRSFQNLSLDSRWTNCMRTTSVAAADHVCNSSGVGR